MAKGYSCSISSHFNKYIHRYAHHAIADATNKRPSSKWLPGYEALDQGNLNHCPVCFYNILNTLFVIFSKRWRRTRKGRRQRRKSARQNWRGRKQRGRKKRNRRGTNSSTLMPVRGNPLPRERNMSPVQNTRTALWCSYNSTMIKNTIIDNIPQKS